MKMNQNCFLEVEKKSCKSFVNLLGRFEIVCCGLGRQSADGLDQIRPKHRTPLTLGTLGINESNSGGGNCIPFLGNNDIKELHV